MALILLFICGGLVLGGAFVFALCLVRVNWRPESEFDGIDQHERQMRALNERRD